MYKFSYSQPCLERNIGSSIEIMFCNRNSVLFVHKLYKVKPLVEDDLNAGTYPTRENLSLSSALRG
jgi:hypothetical protein